ncbi:TIGR03564 family F420-dependent LLM class oxidoreductase [Nocardia cyriacigeorgica]|uniref:TIGR03564 family F420-dependent LLM class oxidoreductase n=2 Tax=Nocardia cyriacigeorgica TaxID=135487 RepID=UPI001E525375|nr:TIGR03564 family F420-dependent LLM class oxidoreductase [Nocardia cyriacigeorgica]
MAAHDCAHQRTEGTGMHIGTLIHEQGTTVNDLVQRAHNAAETGLRGVWLGQNTGWDALTVAAVIGRAVSTVDVGTAVVPTYPRHPLMLAGQALTVQSAMASRLTLGIGVSHPHIIEGQFGYSFERPAQHLREYLQVLMPLLRGESVHFAGERLRAAGRIDVVSPPPPSVLIGALGPAMLRLAGELADGTVTTWIGPSALDHHIVPRLTRAAAAAGRASPRVVVCLFVGVTHNADELRTTLAHRYGAAGEIASYRAALDHEGAGGPEHTAILGDEHAVETRIRRLFDAGATELVAMPVGTEQEQARTAELLGALTK